VADRVRVIFGCLSPPTALDGAVGVDDGSLDSAVNGGPVHAELGGTGGEHHEDTDPETPVAGRGRVEVLADSPAERGVRDASGAIDIQAFTTGGQAGLDERGPDDAPEQDGTTQEGDGCVETGEHARAEEGWGGLEVPAPVVDDEGGAPAPLVEPVAPVPLVEDAGRELVEDAPDEGGEESCAEDASLLAGALGSADGVETLDGDGGGGGRGEDETETEDEEVAQGHGEEASVAESLRKKM